MENLNYKTQSLFFYYFPKLLIFCVFNWNKISSYTLHSLPPAPTRYSPWTPLVPQTLKLMPSFSLVIFVIYVYMCMWVQIFNKYDLLCPLFCLYRYGEHPWETLIHFLPVKIGTVWLLWFDPGQKSHLVTDGQEVVRNTLIRSLSLVFQFKVQNRPLNCQAESQPGGRKACQNQKWLARAQKQDWDTMCWLCQP